MTLEQITKKEDNIVRYESLTIPLSGEGGKEVKLTFQSEDPETMQIETNDQFIGLCEMENFLVFCRRALELWENEVKP